MKVGDLVKFQSSSWVFKTAEKDYRNPGVIIEISLKDISTKYTVMWADGRITTEHFGFIEQVTNEDR